MADDNTIKEWDDATPWQHDDTIALVKSILKGGHAPEQEHGRWFKTKIDKGYVYGLEKNDDASKGPLTNPNLLPYRELPVYSRMKDVLLMTVVIGIAAHYGLAPAKVPEFVFT